MAEQSYGRFGNKATDIQSYIESPEKQRRLYKRTLLIVILSQLFGGAGLAAGVTVGALLAQDMLGTDNLVGLPAAFSTLGSAAAAFLVGRLSQQFGRRIGLALGLLSGGIGAIGIIFAAASHSIILLFISLLIYGAGSATNLQARYAGTDLAQPTERAKAVSISMVSTTFGAMAGPNLVAPLGTYAESMGIPPLAGPFMLSAAAYILAGLVLWVYLRPDPFIVAKVLAEDSKRVMQDDTESPTRNVRMMSVGAAIMILTQLVMTGIMTMTPIHMKHHGHSLAAIGLVIGIHIGFMYLPSLITGVFVDKFGRTAIAMASGAVLLLAGVFAAFSPGDSLFGLILALALLGLGWNLGLISGTTLIVDATHPAKRAKTQGTIDVLIALAGSSGGALSGVVVANSSYATLSLIGGFLSLLLIPVVIWSQNKRAVHKLNAQKDVTS